MLFRLCPAAWAGAAALFVLITVGLTRSPEVESDMRMQLSLIRFPYYYALEFGLLGTALVAGFFARKHGELGTIRSLLGLGLVALALAGAIAVALLATLGTVLVAIERLLPSFLDPLATPRSIQMDDRRIGKPKT